MNAMTNSRDCVLIYRDWENSGMKIYRNGKYCEPSNDMSSVEKVMETGVANGSSRVVGYKNLLMIPIVGKN
jgi:hypothetical protein